MANIRPKTLKFDPPVSTDVQTWRVFIDVPGNLSYTSPMAEGTDLTAQSDGKVHVDLAALPISATLDGIYDIGVAFTDDVGNESDMAVAAAVPVDFQAPNPPTGLVVE